MNQLHPERRVGAVCPECSTQLIHDKEDESFVYCPLPGCGWDIRHVRTRELDMLEVEVNDYGGAPIADHNMPCPICQERKAVLLMPEGRFDPCWECQKDGWSIVRSPLVAWVRSIFDRLFA